MKKTLCLVLISLLIISLVGCQPQDPVVQPHETDFQSLYPEFVIDSNDTSVTYVDAEGQTLSITKKPARTVVLLNSILDLWYLAGGESLARVKGTINVPAEAADLPILGSFASVSAEALLALEPDLVILSSNSSSQKKLIGILKENDIEYASIDTGTQAYEAFQKNLYLFTQILGTESIYEQKVNNITDQCQTIIDQAKTAAQQPSVAVLYVTSKSIRTETEHSLTGEMVSLLGGSNVVSLEEIPVPGSTRVDFSMEVLVARDPEYILICTMGDIDKCQDRIAADIEKSTAWSGLKAVKENKVYYLPKEYSVYKPNAEYPQAFAYLAKILYPEIFSE